MSLKLYPSILALYENLYQQATLHSKFKHKTNRKDRLLICKFKVWLNKNYKQHQINESLLIQFFEFQFSRYSGIVTPKGKNSIILSWIIGPKAINEWQNRNVRKRYLVTWRINKEFKLHLEKTFAQVKVNNIPKYLLSINQYEEAEKRRFFNTKEGYIYCGQFTTLYNPISISCQACSYRTECSERLKINFETLYKIRVK